MNLKLPFLSPLILRIGSTSAMVITCDKKILFSEFARVAVSAQTGHILAFGNKAEELSHLGAPDIIVQPIFQLGIPIDTQLTGAYLSWMRDRLVASKIRRIFPSSVISLVSAQFPLPYEKLYREALRAAHFFPIGFYPAVLGDAWSWIGTKIKTQSVIIVRFGATTTQVALISQDMVVNATSVPYGGEDLDKKISKYIRSRFYISVPAHAVASVKEAMTKASFAKAPLSVVIRGKKANSNSVASLTLTETDLIPVCTQFFDLLAREIATILVAYPQDVEIVLTGGLSLFSFAGERLSVYTKMKISSMNRPLLASLLGIGSKVSN